MCNIKKVNVDYKKDFVINAYFFKILRHPLTLSASKNLFTQHTITENKNTTALVNFHSNTYELPLVRPYHTYCTLTGTADSTLPHICIKSFSYKIKTKP